MKSLRSKPPLGAGGRFFSRPAFSLIEVVIATALFALVLVMSASIFKLTIDGQRRAIASQNVQESLKYFLEVISKEVRMAQPDIKAPYCNLSLPRGRIFSISASGGQNTLSFKNHHNECVTYRLDAASGRFHIKRGNRDLPISPAKIEIESLRFVLGASPTAQELVTVNMRARSREAASDDAEMVLQTSLSSRYYKENN